MNTSRKVKLPRLSGRTVVALAAVGVSGAGTGMAAASESTSRNEEEESNASKKYRICDSIDNYKEYDRKVRSFRKNCNTIVNSDSIATRRAKQGKRRSLNGVSVSFDRNSIGGDKFLRAVVELRNPRTRIKSVMFVNGRYETFFRTKPDVDGQSKKVFTDVDTYSSDFKTFEFKVCADVPGVRGRTTN